MALGLFKKKEQEDFTQRPPPIDLGPSQAPGLPRGMPPVSLPPPPAPPVKAARGAGGVTLLTEDLEEISEAIVQEKWNKFEKDWDKLMDWKDDMDESIVELRTTLKNIDDKMDTIEKAVLGKVGDYSKSIGGVKTELKAMQKVFSDVMPVFTENVKKLKELTGKE
jgi:hypothetical protein